MKDITITVKRMKENLTNYLEREPTDKELNRFIDCIERDIPQFLVDNAKYFIKEEL